MSDPPNLVTIFVGPMFSGKSLQLIQQAHRAIRGGKEVLAAKPKKDIRDSDKIATSLDDPINGKATEWSYDDVCLVNESEKAQLVRYFNMVEPDVLIIDEIQFFDSWLVKFVRDIQSERTCEVYLAGLDQTAWRKPFGPTPKLLALADRVQKLQADCFVSDCPRKARFTQLKYVPDDQPDNSQVIVGGEETYEARCGECWVHPDNL